MLAVQTINVIFRLKTSVYNKFCPTKAKNVQILQKMLNRLGIQAYKLSVCKVMFGAELKDYEIYDFILKNYYWLRFSPVATMDVKEVGRNPKRVQREEEGRYRISG